MAVLSASDRDNMPKKEFAQPEKKGFPLNDKTHDREAISGATRSEHAGNISASEADRIKSEARAKLNDGKGGDPPADHKAAVAKMHPEHVHKLVQDAHAGKYGPEAQKAAQSAMQAPQQSMGGAPDDGADGGNQYSDMFGGGGAAPAPAAPPSHAEMFGGRR